jgi:hypothetical protein
LIPELGVGIPGSLSIQVLVLRHVPRLLILVLDVGVKAQKACCGARPRFLNGTIAAMAAKVIHWELKCKTCGKWSRLLFEPNCGPSVGGPRFVNCATPECRDGWDMEIPGNFISVAQSSRVD